ncbi:MAG: radical SAM protein [Alphaproteobacteria bacterium]|nr:MAG: radical SAM protein [Alphaproteobacteria bacterium]
MDQTLPKANAGKFIDPAVTADGSPRARVGLVGLKTLWFNTGTLCNIACTGCYIESSPTNDRLEYLRLKEMRAYLDEAEALGAPLEEVGFTGGEPFMNPDIIRMIEAALARGYRVLVLTNAMRPMMRPRLQAGLKKLVALYGERLTLRVSLDHWRAEQHDAVRGPGSFAETLAGMDWLQSEGLRMAVAGRALWGVPEAEARAEYGRLFFEQNLKIDAQDPASLVIFPDMDESVEVPEITTACWGILGKSPEALMCASSRMVIKRRGMPPSVVACTLLPYDARFELGTRLAEAAGEVALNHPHCAKFCVLGGASCSV